MLLLIYYKCLKDTEEKKTANLIIERAERR